MGGSEKGSRMEGWGWFGWRLKRSSSSSLLGYILTGGVCIIGEN